MRNLRNLDKDYKRAVELLDRLSDDATDSATKEELRAWFWSDVSRQAKDAALSALFRQLTPNPAPDESDRKKYAELSASLHMDLPVRKRRTVSPLRVLARIAAAAVLLHSRKIPCRTVSSEK